MSTMACPKCAKAIPFEATTHEACGWGITPIKGLLSRPSVPCAHDGCPDPAILSRRLPTGWANLCKKHDLFHAQQEADEYCREHGFDTREKKIAHVRKILMTQKPTPTEHWKKVMETPNLTPMAYEMAKNYLDRHARGEEAE